MSQSARSLPPRVSAIVPAAGRSRRMGRPKLLLPYGDETVIGSTISALRRGGVTRTVVVIGPDDTPLRRWAERKQLEVRINPRPDRGMLSSIQEGLLTLGSLEPEDVLLVNPADLPLLSADSVRSLIQAFTASRARLATPTYSGRNGHPLALTACLADEIFRLDPEVGLRQLAQEYASDILRVDVPDPGVLRDIDTPEDYARLLLP